MTYIPGELAYEGQGYDQYLADREANEDYDYDPEEPAKEDEE